jgi:CubicO group peptidase (beta-lactamase class C family)
MKFALKAAAAAWLTICLSACVASPDADRTPAVLSATVKLPDAALNRIEAAAATFTSATGLNDYSLLLMDGENTLYRRDFGAYTSKTVIPIASAGKWITGATVMTLVDEGRLNLDEPIKAYLPELPATHANLTLRQLLSYTAGFASLQEGAVDVRQDKTITLDQAVRELSKLPLADRPGETFAYGGANFQFVGAIVERVTGKSWNDYFREALGDPLGMTPLYWSNPAGPNPPDQVRNPLLQGGAATTLDAYQPLLTMITQRGVYGGRRYLSEAAIIGMETIATRGVRMRYVPAGAAPGAQYGLAHWCEVEGPSGCTMLSSPGAFGVYPWIDRKAGLHGVIFVQDQLARIDKDLRVLRDEMIAAAIDVEG